MSKLQTTTTKKKKTPKNRRPLDMTLREWQTALRIEYGEEQDFAIKNLGDHPVFSEFSVYNAKSDKTYRVAIRGEQTGEAYCSCPDFAVNTLGICKHIAYVKATLRKKHENIKHLKNKFIPSYSEIFVRYGEQRKIIVSVGTDAPIGAGKWLKTYVNSDSSLKPYGFSCFNTFLRKMKTGGHEVRCYDDALEMVAEVNDAVRRQRIVGKLFSGPATTKIKNIKATLYSYQIEGVKFALTAGRSIIADEMGLGKTLQAIAAAEMFAQHFSVERVLIVSPTSVKYQWKSEIEKFCNRSVQIIEGPLHIRKEQYDNDIFFSIASYEQVYRDVVHVNRREFDLIVLDETQRIKNWNTRTAKSIKELKSTYAIALTGTPLENRIEEIHSIVEFIDKYKLGPLFSFLNHHEIKDERDKVIGYQHLSEISKSLQTILLRRKKVDVQQQLPPRLEKVHFTQMTRLQTEYHNENSDIVKRIAAKWAKYHYLSDADQRRLLTALQRMRMACNDAYLVDKKNKDGHKITLLREVLQDIIENGDEKVVIFSQWTTMHELVTEMLDDAGIGYVYLHGGVPAAKRMTLMDTFRINPETKVFLSTDAGQTGLNLQNASVCINLDLPWNPAKLEQRIGRVYRIGQQRSVRVINFIARGTIEQGMINVLKFKKSLFSGILDGGENTVMMGDTRLNSFMKGVVEITQATEKEKIVPSEIKTENVDSSSDVERNEKTCNNENISPENETITAFLHTGMQLLSSFINAAASKGKSDNSTSSFSKDVLVETDPKTGKMNLKIPLPEEETIKKFAKLAVPFLSRLLDM